MIVTKLNFNCFNSPTTSPFADVSPYHMLAQQTVLFLDLFCWWLSVDLHSVLYKYPGHLEPFIAEPVSLWSDVESL